ncbi:PKD domain-containing protein, partial [bacterium]|nr:PKD domain-containing protein [bacterium]
QFTGGSWNNMSELTLDPGTAGITEYVLIGSASYELIDICSNYGVSNRLVCDKICFVNGNAGPFNLPPVPVFSLDECFSESPLTVNVDASASYDFNGSISLYSWDFGDGTASGSTANHTYTSSGAYIISLTVTDNNGKTATVSRTVEVFASAPSTAWDAEIQQGGSIWETAYGNYSDYSTWRVLIRGEDVLFSGNRICLTFHGTLNQEFCPRRVSIAKRDGETLDVIDSTYTQVTFDGNTWNEGVTVGSDVTVTSNPVIFDLVAGEDLVMTFFSDKKPAVLKHQAGETIAWITENHDDQSQTVDWEEVTGLRTTQYMYAISVVTVGIH